MGPVIAEIVAIQEPIASHEGEISQTHRRGLSLRSLTWSLEAPSADGELVQMIVLPTEDELQRAMQLRQRVLTGHAERTPDLRGYRLQVYAEHEVRRRRRGDVSGDACALGHGKMIGRTRSGPQALSDHIDYMDAIARARSVSAVLATTAPACVNTLLACDVLVASTNATSIEELLVSPSPICFNRLSGKPRSRK